MLQDKVRRGKNVCLYPHLQLNSKTQNRNIHFFGNISLSWFFIKYFQKHKGFFSFWPNSSGNFFVEAIFHFLFFVEIIFNFSAEIKVFGLKFRITLLSRCALKTFLLKIIIFKKTCTCAWKKIWNCFIVYFWSMWSIKYKIFWQISLQRAKKGFSLPFFAHCTLIRQNILYLKLHIRLGFSTPEFWVTLLSRCNLFH